MDAATQAKFYEYIDEHKEEYINHLRAWVEIASVSCQADTRELVFRQIELTKKEFEDIGCEMRIVNNPIEKQAFADGTIVNYPPVLLGTYPKVFDPAKKTILLYGHLDVQPAQKSDGWDYEPFELTVDNGKMFGRGSTDDKGPVLGWLIALKAFQALNVDLPVNLRLCFEGMEESGSVGLDELIFNRTEDHRGVIDERKFFSEGVDGTCISDNYWLGTTKPCVTYGLRGIAYFHLEVECADRDLHSGVFGGTCHEAMTDCVQIFASFVDNRANILIEGISDKVAPITQEEIDTYKDIDFCTEEYRKSMGINLLHANDPDCKAKTLQGRWRYPTLSLHGIEGAFAEPGEKTVIPRKVIGKFSLRLVPDMCPKEVDELVKAHVEKMKKQLNSPNKITVRAVGLGKPWYGNPTGFLYSAASRATEHVYKQKPDMTREGGSIPVTLSFQDATQKSVMLLPMGSADDGAHSQNEKLNISNYIGGIKLLGTFLQELRDAKD